MCIHIYICFCVHACAYMCVYNVYVCVWGGRVPPPGLTWVQTRDRQTSETRIRIANSEIRVEPFRVRVRVHTLLLLAKSQKRSSSFEGRM